MLHGDVTTSTDQLHMHVVNKAMQKAKTVRTAAVDQVVTCPAVSYELFRGLRDFNCGKAPSRIKESKSGANRYHKFVITDTEDVARFFGPTDDGMNGIDGGVQKLDNNGSVVAIVPTIYLSLRGADARLRWSPSFNQVVRYYRMKYDVVALPVNGEWQYAVEYDENATDAFKYHIAARMQFLRYEYNIEFSGLQLQAISAYEPEIPAELRERWGVGTGRPRARGGARRGSGRA